MWNMIRFSVLAALTICLAQSLSAQPAHPAASCSNSSLTGNYGFTIGGTDANGPIAIMGQIATDGNGTIAGIATTSSNGVITDRVDVLGLYHINPNCTGTAVITPAGQSKLNFALSLIGGGKQIELVETDKGTVESGTAYSQGIDKCSLGAVKGVYSVKSTGAAVGSGPLVYGGQITLHGGGTLSGSLTGSVNGKILTHQKVSGGYKVGKPCTGGASVAVGNQKFIGWELVVVNGGNGVLFIQSNDNTLWSGMLSR